MPLTVATLEADLIVLLGPTLRRVGLDGVTVDGTNPSLRIPIRRAAKRLGVSVAGSAVTDEELATLDPDNEDAFLELSRFHALNLILWNWPEVDEQAGEESQSLSQLADRIQKEIKELTASLGALTVDPAVVDANNEATAANVGSSSAALIRTGLDYPPCPVPNQRVRSAFYYGGRFYP